MSRLATTSLRALTVARYGARQLPRPVAPGYHAPQLPTPQQFAFVLRARSTSAKTKQLEEPEEPVIDIDAELEAKGAADLFDEVELDGAEWEGEEVEEGVFISVPEPAKPTASRPNRPQTTSIKHLNRLLSRHQVPDIPEHELEEKFVRGRGPGGQAINKTNSSVSLIHIPTGIRVQSQPTRSRAQNRIIARQILKERLDLLRARGELPDAMQAAGAKSTNTKSTQASPSTKEATASSAETETPQEEPPKLSRKERLAAEARLWSKQELRWEKERRRKANRAKKVKRRKNEGDGEGGEAEGEGDK